jgi:hypothetical protein
MKENTIGITNTAIVTPEAANIFSKAFCIFISFSENGA